jgi:hypothetical protein
MSATTLVFVRYGQVGKQRFDFGEELPPNLIPREVIDRWLDSKFLIELDSRERVSLYRVFSPLSGCTEREPLTREEIDEFCLPK